MDNFVIGGELLAIVFALIGIIQQLKRIVDKMK